MMDQIAKMLISAVVILIITFGTEGKFRYIYQGMDEKKIVKRVDGLSSIIIQNNRKIKYVGLIVIWVGYNLAVGVFNSEIHSLVAVPYIIMGLGFIIYVVSRLWPMLGK